MMRADLLPMILYKYLRARYALDALTTKRLKVSTIEELNDIYDCAPSVSIDGVHQREATRTFSKQVGERIGLISYTTRDNSHLMWAHYADSHRGMALGFEFSGPRDRVAGGRRIVTDPEVLKYGLMLAPVTPDARRYSRPRKITYPANNERPLVELRNVENLQTTDEYLSTIEELYSVKGPEWEYEDEWRRFLRLEEGFVTKNSGGLYFEKFDESWLRFIIIGARCRKEDFDEVMKLALFGLKNVTIYKAYRHDTLNLLQRVPFECCLQFAIISPRAYWTSRNASPAASSFPQTHSASSVDRPVTSVLSVTR